MQWVQRMNDALAYVAANVSREISVEELCRVACVSRTDLQYLFQLVTDMAPTEYIRACRLHAAALELMHTREKVIDIALKYGYNSAAAFTRAFGTYCGVSPSVARRQGCTLPPIPTESTIKITGGEMNMNWHTLLRIEEHQNEKVIAFTVNTMDPETAVWGQMADWCKQYLPDRATRRYLGVAPKGHHPDGEQHQNADEHVSHPYTAMVFLLGDEGKQPLFHGKEVLDAPQGLYLVNDVALNQHDENGKLDMALSMIKASEAFTEFMAQSKGYAFDMGKGIFYEEHIFSEEWFRTGGVPDGFRMWVPIIKTE